MCQGFTRVRAAVLIYTKQLLAHALRPSLLNRRATLKEHLLVLKWTARGTSTRTRRKP